MNCKQGDLAVHIGGRSGINSKNLGKVMTCIEFKGKVPGWGGEDIWLVNADIVLTDGGVASYSRDRYLRPLRNNLGQDETLNWAPVPITEEIS